MINKESLFIGCWVHVPCLVDKVEGIDGNRRIKQLYDDTCDVEGFKELKYSEIEPIPITSEILEKNGFIKDGYTNLSPDYYLETKDYCICVNLTPTCTRDINISCENKLTRRIATIDEAKSSPNRKQLYVQDLEALIRVAGINKEIIV